MIVCWSVKGGSGTTVISAALAILQAQQSQHGAILVDLAGDVPAALGIADTHGHGVIDWLGTKSATSPSSLLALAIQATENLQVIPRGNCLSDTNRSLDWHKLARVLTGLDSPIVVDAGCGQPSQLLIEQASSSLLVTRKCYLSLRRASQVKVPPTGVVLINEHGRALTRKDVEAVIGAPVIAEVTVDPSIARSVDAGMIATRLPISFTKQLAMIS